MQARQQHSHSCTVDTVGATVVPRDLMVADIGNQPQTYKSHKRFTEVLRGLQLPGTNSKTSRKRKAGDDEDSDDECLKDSDDDSD